MKTKYYLLTLFAVLAVALSACGAQVPAVPTDAPAAVGTAMIAVTGGASLNAVPDASGNLFLVDGAGMTVYINTNDTPDTSNCYDDCAAEWPPVISSGDDASAVGLGVEATKVGTLTRTDGTVQVTYNGWPLYTFANDTQIGDMLGQGDEGIWFMVSSAGESIQP